MAAALPGAGPWSLEGDPARRPPSHPICRRRACVEGLGGAGASRACDRFAGPLAGRICRCSRGASPTALVFALRCRLTRMASTGRARARRVDRAARARNKQHHGPSPAAATRRRPQRTHKGPDHRPDFAQVRAASRCIGFLPCSRQQVPVPHCSPRRIIASLCLSVCLSALPLDPIPRLSQVHQSSFAHACMHAAALRSLAPPPGTPPPTPRRRCLQSELVHSTCKHGRCRCCEI